MNLNFAHCKKTRPLPSLTAGIESLRKEMDRPHGIYERHESFVKLASDPSMRAEIEHVAQKYNTNALRYVVLVGIGGQNLGVEAVHSAVSHSWGPYARVAPKLVGLDTVHPEYVEDLLAMLTEDVKHKEELLIIISSKSGTTTETLSNSAVLLDTLTKHLGDIDDRIVVISDLDSPLQQYAAKKNWGFVPMPKMIGGRFSVLSSAGLFPLRMLGIDIDSLLKGAQDVFMHQVALGTSQDALRTAESLLAIEQETPIWNFFYFLPQFENLGKWSRQLIAESLGKEKDRNGKIVRRGITPIVSIGSTDLHSMAQLYFGGPKDKFTTILTVNDEHRIHIKEHKEMLALFGYKKKESLRFDQILRAIESGVFAAYDKHELPYQHMQLGRRDTYHVGTYIAWLELTTYLLAQGMNVDPFDQPNVEDYKSGTKHMLL